MSYKSLNHFVSTNKMIPAKDIDKNEEDKEKDETDPQLNIIKNKLSFLTSLINLPPSLNLFGFQEVSSTFNNWKDHIYDILIKNKISPTWILDIINLDSQETSNKVQIQFISHSVKTKVYIELCHFIQENNFKMFSVENLDMTNTFTSITLTKNNANYENNLHLLHCKTEALLNQLLNASYITLYNFEQLHYCNPNLNWKFHIYNLFYVLDLPQSWILDLHDLEAKNSKIPDKIQIFFISEHIQPIVKNAIISYLNACPQNNTIVV